MDTFNFSFFDEKNPADEDASPAPASAAPHHDPFEDDAFADFGMDMIENEAAPHLLADEPVLPIQPQTPAFSLSNETGIQQTDELMDAPFSSPLALSPEQADDAFRLDVASTLDSELPNWANSSGAQDDIEQIPPPATAPGDVAPPPAEKVVSKSGFAGYKTEGASVPAEAPSAPPEFELPPSFVDPASPFMPEEEDFSPIPEIRAAVEPAVFLTPAVPLSDSPAMWAPAEEVETPMSDRSGVRYATVDDPFAPIAPTRARLRVAVLGASGIGKDHARWLVKNGGEMVAFLGSSADSVEGTRAHLAASMGFDGQGFSDLGELLAQTQPQAVVVASPSPFHYAQAMQCLEAGIHVLCEKPLVYSPGRSKRENMDGAKELLRAAAKRDLVLATQLQYGGATPILCRLAGVSPVEVGDFAMEVETTNVKSPRDPKALWIELASHPLSVAQYLAGEGAQILKDSVQLSPSRSGSTTEIFARFGVQCEGGRLLMCRAIVRWFDKMVDNRPPRRRFSFNGRVVQYAGIKGESGSYIAQYVAPDGYISHYPDPVDYLVGNFVRTCWREDELILSAEQGVQNLDWLLTTADKITA